jgi:hypothetical protein
MKRSSSVVVAIVAVLLPIPSVVSGQNIVVNGSFENPRQAVPGSHVAGGQYVHHRLDRLAVQHRLGGLGWLSADAAYSLDLNGNNDEGNCAIGGIRQDVAGLTPGASCDLSFAMAGNPGPSLLDKTLVVLWGPSADRPRHSRLRAERVERERHGVGHDVSTRADRTCADDASRIPQYHATRPAAGLHGPGALLRGADPRRRDSRQRRPGAGNRCRAWPGAR